MVDGKKELNIRKEKIKSWIRNNYNLGLILVVILGFAIRLYYLYVTSGQTLWWDEAEYMSVAKQWASGIVPDLNPQRPPLFQFLSALIFMAGFGENLVKFLLVIIPSSALIVAIFYLGKEMYNEKIGLISAFLSMVSWTLLFWTSRIQPDSLTLVFQVLSILFIWRYWKKPESRTIIYSGVFAALAFYFKISALLVPLIFFVFMIMRDKLEMFKKKDYYYFALAFILTMLPYFIWAYITFGSPFAFKTGYSSAVDAAMPFYWGNLNFFISLTTPGIMSVSQAFLNLISIQSSVLFFLFIIGLVISLKFLLYFDIVLKDKNNSSWPRIFSVLTLIIVSAFYIFYIRGTEDRWVFLWMPFIFFIAGEAIENIEKYASRFGKKASLAIVILLLLLAGYSQLSYTDALVKVKENSYEPVKLAGIWIKDNSNTGDKVMSISYTQTRYYSERETMGYSDMQNSSAFSEYLDKEKPKFIEVSLFEKHPSWMFQQGQQGNYRILAFPYFNSSIVFDNTGKVVGFDLKKSTIVGNKEFDYVYPTDRVDGMFVYEVKYI